MQKIIIPMKGRMMHSVRRRLTFQPYGKDESEVINSISRADLNIALMEAAESAGRQNLLSATLCGSRSAHGLHPFA